MATDRKPAQEGEDNKAAPEPEEWRLVFADGHVLDGWDNREGAERYRAARVLATNGTPRLQSRVVGPWTDEEAE